MENYFYHIKSTITIEMKSISIYERLKDITELFDFRLPNLDEIEFKKLKQIEFESITIVHYSSMLHKAIEQMSKCLKVLNGENYNILGHSMEHVDENYLTDRQYYVL